MPYKDKEKDKARLKKYYEDNKELVKKRGRDYYSANREKVLKQHAEKPDLKEACKEWKRNNKDKVKKYKKEYEEKNREQHLTMRRKSIKRAIQRLPDYYVANQIKQQTGISMKTIKANPELIENHRQQIKLKRLLKNKKNG